MKDKKPSIETTIRQMKIDDTACQMAMRYHLNPARLEEDNHHTRTVRDLARVVIEEKRYPETVGEWIAMVLLHGHTDSVKKMREHARRAAQVSYMQAERWLNLIDRSRAA
ncbi:MAG: hypothetical protein AAF787_16710 [Chloroflexota bacterium]